MVWACELSSEALFVSFMHILRNTFVLSTKQALKLILTTTINRDIDLWKPQFYRKAIIFVTSQLLPKLNHSEPKWTVFSHFLCFKKLFPWFWKFQEFSITAPETFWTIFKCFKTVKISSFRLENTRLLNFLESATSAIFISLTGKNLETALYLFDRAQKVLLFQSYRASGEMLCSSITWLQQHYTFLLYHSVQ